MNGMETQEEFDAAMRNPAMRAAIMRAPVVTPPPILSALGGAVQGAAAGFGDEIGGAVEATLAGAPFGLYRQKRDEIRQNLAYSAATNPKAALGGEIAGSLATALIPGGGAAKGMTTLGRIGRAAATGGLYGAGASEADLAAGDVAGTARDVAASAALSAGFAGVGAKLAGGAPARADKRLIRQLGASVKLRTQDEILKDRPNILSVLKRYGLAQHVPNRSALAPVSKEALDVVGEALGKTTAKADAISEGMPIGRVVRELQSVKDSMADNPATARLKDAIQSEIDDALMSRWPVKNGHVPFTAIHDYSTRLNARAFTTLSKTEGKQIARDMAGAVRSALKGGLGELEKTNPNAGPIATQFRALSADYSSLKRINDATARAAREEAFGPGRLTGLVAQGRPLTARLVEAGKSAVGGAAVAADRGMAGIVNAVRNGGTPGDVARIAAHEGFPRLLGHRLSRRFAAKGEAGLPVETEEGWQEPPSEGPPAPARAATKPSAKAVKDKVVPDEDVIVSDEDVIL